MTLSCGLFHEDEVEIFFNVNQVFGADQNQRLMNVKLVDLIFVGHDPLSVKILHEILEENPGPQSLGSKLFECSKRIIF